MTWALWAPTFLFISLQELAASRSCPEKDGHLVLHSKTTLTHGPAVMVIHQEDTALFLHYRDVMQPNFAGSSTWTSNLSS